MAGSGVHKCLLPLSSAEKVKNIVDKRGGVELCWTSELNSNFSSSSIADPGWIIL